MRETSAFEFIGVTKRFGQKTVLNGIHLKIASGSIQFIVGLSGAGKSVLMKHPVGLLKADDGRVLFEGADVTDYREPDFFEIRRRTSYVFQHATLLDGLSVTENVALPIRQRFSLRSRAATERALVELERLHLLPFRDRLPAELGVGVKKRVAIARAVALDPRHIIYDEPTTGLDPVSARRIDDLIRELRVREVTQVVVSHDLVSIFEVAERIAFLHQGTVRIEGTPEELRKSEDPVTRQFLSGNPLGPIA